MNYDDALEILGSTRNPDVSWRNRHDDHYDQQFPGQRFPTGPPGQMSFQVLHFSSVTYCYYLSNLSFAL